MKKLNLKVNIRTRLLAYFLFASILPLCVLTVSSTTLFQQSIGPEVSQVLLDKLTAKNNNLIFQVALVSALAGMSLAYIFSRIIANPIIKIIKATKSIEEGDFTQRVEINSEDEIGYLAQSFNNMTQGLLKRSQEVKSYNQLLIQQHDKLEMVINSSTDGILTIDKNSEIKSANPQICAWKGLDKNKIIGKSLENILLINKTENDLEEFPQSLNNAQVINEQTNEKYYLDINCSSMKSDSNQQISNNYVLILRDVTEKKELDKIKEDFVATLTHDLKVPILANVQNLEYMKKGSYGELTEKQAFITDHLISSNQDLLRMVNTILDTYKYEAGKYNLVLKKVDLCSIITDGIKDLIPLLKQKEHFITFVPHSEVININADRQEFKRVIINLINNAIIYTPNNGTIKVYTIEEEDNVVVIIEDNGIGIADSYINNLFQRYSKESNNLRKIGTGLGLYLSKQIVEAHGGRIWAESEKNKGSKFQFCVKIYK